MGTDVIVLNGVSSSGKSSIARCLQSVLSPSWLTFGIDSLIQAMPLEIHGHRAGMTIGSDGTVVVGSEFRRLEMAWHHGLAATARAGAGIIVDDVFLGGGASQARLRSSQDGLAVLWVAVHCDTSVAVAREMARGDRVLGLAASQSELVHVGVDYDVHVDTTHTSSMDCARTIAAHVVA
jgi:chloramphenicol 3-O phosphotransferase